MSAERIMEMMREDGWSSIPTWNENQAHALYKVANYIQWLRNGGPQKAVEDALHEAQKKLGW